MMVTAGVGATADDVWWGCKRKCLLLVVAWTAAGWRWCLAVAGALAAHAGGKKLTRHAARQCKGLGQKKGKAQRSKAAGWAKATKAATAWPGAGLGGTGDDDDATGGQIDSKAKGKDG